MLLATILLPICRRLAIDCGVLMDVPSGDRKVHQNEIPRSGGIAIFGGAFVAGLVWINWTMLELNLVVSLLVIAAFGLLDDFIELGYKFKFLGQVIATCVFLLGNGGFSDLPFLPLDSTPPALAIFVSFFFLIGITNAVNLSDGLDGLAAGNSLLSLGLIALFAYQLGQIELMIIALVVTGGLVGFLRFNTHPASIFMGDMGSQFIGFVAGVLALSLFGNEEFAASPAIALLLFGLPILDTIGVMALRLIRRRSIFSADRSHIHHQLLRLGLRHYEVVAVMYFMQALCVGLAYALRYSPDWQIVLAYVLFCISVLGVIALLRIKKIEFRTKGTGKTSKDRRNRWIRNAWYFANTARVISAGSALLFLGISGLWLFLGSEWIAPSWSPALPIVLAMALVGMPSYIDLISRAICYIGSAAVIYMCLFGGIPLESLIVIDIYVALLLLALILAIRVTRREVFHLDTQDYLVVLLVGFTPLIAPAEIAESLVVRSVLYLAIIFYACEYVLTKGNKTKWVVNLASLAALFIFVLN